MLLDLLQRDKMTRRDFAKRMFELAVTIAASPFIPLPKTAYQKLASYNHLYGIPYHQSDASTGTWLGIVRSEVPMWNSKPLQGRPIDKEVMRAIKKMLDSIEKDKMKEL